MLTPRKKSFVDHYISTRNATESAKQSGYSTKTAYSIGSRLLKDVEVRALIDKAMEKEHGKLSKETFVDLAMRDYKAVEQDSNNRPRFLQLAGQGAGIIGTGNDSKPNQSINLTQINITNSENQTELWDIARKLLGT